MGTFPDPRSTSHRPNLITNEGHAEVATSINLVRPVGMAEWAEHPSGNPKDRRFESGAGRFKTWLNQTNDFKI